MWHGASWNFIIWGLFYALLLLLEKLVFMPIGEKINKGISTVVSYVYMIFVTLVGWTIFYYTEDLLPRLKVMFGIGSPIGDIYEMSILRSNLFLLVVAVIFCTPIIPKLLCKITSKMGENGSYAIGRIFKTVFAVVAIALSTAMLAGNSYNPFLYFRF
jgi:alginate O-acetyltransferase complex protein AlgI